MKRKFYLAVLSVPSPTAIGNACAANSTESDAPAISGTEIRVAKEVTAADQHV
jgi:hypothetical protein